jgi:RND family efflux transporter MFP subunit
MTSSATAGTARARSAARQLALALLAVLAVTAQPAQPGTDTAADDRPALASALVAAMSTPQTTGHDGVVEAVRQTVLSAQVSGAVVALQVKAGDRVRAGQLLLQLDARAARQQAGAADAQVQAARAQQDAATKEFERQKQLFQKSYISLAALERAEAQFKAAQAQSAVQLAVAGAARTESGFYTVTAPYAGIVSEVSVVLGDMAMPGRPLLTVYDPAALRVVVAVPQSAAAALAPASAPRVELPSSSPERFAPLRWQRLPSADRATHTVQLWLDLPPGHQAAPGMFARVWLPGAAADAARLSVPPRAVVRRAELTAVYVIGTDGRPLLRQVRLGPAGGDAVEVLSGLSAGERVALDPQAAARVR